MKAVVDDVREWLHNLNHAKNWQAIGTIKSRAHAEGQEQALWHQLRDDGERWLHTLLHKAAGERIRREKLVAAEAEIKRLRAGFEHIAKTCIEDPDTAQFACRFPNGSAGLP